MSFIRAGPNSACNENIEVKIAKRDQLHFVESTGTTIVPIEIGIDRVIAIAISHVPSAKSEEIRRGIKNALEFLKIPHRFDA